MINCTFARALILHLVLSFTIHVPQLEHQITLLLSLEGKEELHLVQDRYVVSFSTASAGHVTVL